MLKAFDLKTLGIPYTALLKQRQKNLQAALDDYGMEGEADYHKHWINDSAHIFKESFGYASNSFIAPAYIWDAGVNKHLAEVKVKTLQGMKLQYEPKRSIMKNNYSRKMNYIGQTDKKSGLVFSPRNTFFEPSSAIVILTQYWIV